MLVSACNEISSEVDTDDLRPSLERTVSSVFDLLQLTHDSGRWELQLVQAQETFAHPRCQFAAERVR